MEYVKKRVTEDRNSKQNPQAARIDDYDHREGDFVFVVPKEFRSLQQKEPSFIKAEEVRAEDLKTPFLQALEFANQAKNEAAVTKFRELAKRHGATDAEIDSVLNSSGSAVTLAELYNRTARLITRRFLAASAKGYVPDGPPGQHSPFSERFIEFLRIWSSSDQVGDPKGLFSHLENLMPTPIVGWFGNNESVGDFLFISNKAGSAIHRKGKDYALLIATDNYQNWPRLNNPIHDAKTIADDLRSNYGFETEILQNPTKDEIVGALRKYRDRKYSDEDQLLVFFAGHGYYSEELKEGFIVAADSAKSDNTLGANESQLSNTMLAKILDVMPCKHIFLVLDTGSGGRGALDERVR